LTAFFALFCAFFCALNRPILGQKAKNLHFFSKKMKVIVNLRSPVSFFLCIFAAEIKFLIVQ